MTARCIDQPVSWLRLERYRLGEVDGAERASMAAHLARCPACAACVEIIDQEEAVALPPLPSARKAPARGRRWFDHRLAVFGTSGALALAAVLLVLGERRGSVVDPGPVARVKGDAVAFSLVRDDDQRIDDARGVFRDGDRFKAVVTCPRSFDKALDETFDLVVYDADGASFPLALAHVACGNEVPLPGAFRLSGAHEETVCLAWGRDRGQLRAGPPADRALCKRLTPAPARP